MNAGALKMERAQHKRIERSGWVSIFKEYDQSVLGDWFHVA